MARDTRLRVLIADDSAIYARILGRLLAAQPDIRVLGTARDGREAAALARELAPDVALIDVFMPEGGGLTAMRAVAAGHPAIRIIALSARDDDGLRARCLAAGAGDLVFKGDADWLLLPLVRGVPPVV